MKRDAMPDQPNPKQLRILEGVPTEPAKPGDQQNLDSTEDSAARAEVREHRLELGFASDERPLGVGCAKDDRVVQGTAYNGTTEVALNDFQMSARLRELDA